MKIKIETDYPITISQLANEIWKLDDEEQAMLIKELVNIDEPYNICMQLECFCDYLIKYGKDDYLKDVKWFVSELYERLCEE